jgi:ribonucleotide monophosphatase NagD (HAD superfamily)
MVDSIIFDWKRTLYDPDSRSLIAGAKEVLELARQNNIPLVLIGKGGDDMQAEVDRLGVREFFTDVIFREGSKDANLFESKVSKEDPRNTLFIGDRVRSELAIGTMLHVTTIWIRQGKFAGEEPENEAQKSAYTFSSLAELKTWLQSQF